MSCDVAAAAALYLAFVTPSMDETSLRQPAALFAVRTGANPLSREPLYADIIRRARSLRASVDQMRSQDRPDAASLLQAPVSALSALDMKAHLDLAARGTDGDLKCILKGISQDLPAKLAKLSEAADLTARRSVLEEMSYLLRDNIEVITAPPQPAA